VCNEHDRSCLLNLLFPHAIQPIKQIAGCILDIGHSLGECSFRIISETHDSGIRELLWKKVLQPELSVGICPCLLPMTTKPMDRNNANAVNFTSRVFWRNSHSMLYSSASFWVPRTKSPWFSGIDWVAYRQHQLLPVEWSYHISPTTSELSFSFPTRTSSLFFPFCFQVDFTDDHMLTKISTG
jgi:hypothetical protein